MRALWRRLKYLSPSYRRAAERDMQDELQSLAEMAGPGELGNLTLAAEDARSVWEWTRLEQIGRDVRFAIRVLRKRPGFTVTAVLSLALGIGANTALFTLINAVTWRMLPVANPEGLLLVSQRQSTVVWHAFTYQQYRLIRDHNRVLDLASFAPVRLNVSLSGHVESPVSGLIVSGSYFPILGIRPAAGRSLGPDDDRAPMGHPVAMISHAYWKRRFNLDPAIVGRQLALSGAPFTIVGVTPPEFFGVEVGKAPDVFVPVMMQPIVMPVSENLLDHPLMFSTWLRAVGRLRPGVSAAQAVAALDALAQEAEWRPPGRSGQPVDAKLELTSAATGLSDLRHQYSVPLRILLGIVGIVLLIACANTGNLMLARSAARRTEFAVRLALGAGRSRLIRQVLIEALVVAGIAGVCGVGLAFGATQVLVAYVSTGRDAVVLDISPDARVLMFTAVVSILTGLLFAALPAIRATRIDPFLGSARDLLGARNAIGTRLAGKWLVVLQVALSLMLVMAAGLFLRSLTKLHGQQTGIDRAHVLVVRVEPRGSDQRNLPGVSDRLNRTYRDLLARVETARGVLSASLARSSPLSPISYSTSLELPDGKKQGVPCLMIYPRYFATMGIAIEKGRDFEERDLVPGSQLVALVNETFVREVLQGQEPLGQHGLGLAGKPIEIIGVVKDSRYPDLRNPPPPMLYQTFLQTRTGRGQMVLHVRFTGDAGAVISQVRDAVQRIDETVPTFQIHTLADEVNAALVRERLIAALSGFFGVVALILVCVGLYGLMSFTVSRRTAEIGVRIAFGAAPASVAWLIVRQSLVLVLAGIVVGLPAVWIIARLASRQLSPMLFELAPSDPGMAAAAASLLLVVAMCAGLIPAIRAARIDPIVALRND